MGHRRVTEHDLRANCGLMPRHLHLLNSYLLTLSRATTQRIHQRRPERVKPLNLGSDMGQSGFYRTALVQDVH